jgi:hypothetical protein
MSRDGFDFSGCCHSVDDRLALLDFRVMIAPSGWLREMLVA